MSYAGIYGHIPFCHRKCAYCDFPSIAGREDLYRPYVEALLRQIVQERAAWSHWTFDSLYIGGGTPTVLPVELLVEILATCRAQLPMVPDAEITIEANPGTVTLFSLKALRQGGYTRLSLGVQSFSDAELALLGRIHDARAAREAFQAARKAGWENINIDLIFGIPYQTLEGWRYSLEQALSLGPEHLSLYALTLEPGTPLEEKIAQGALPAPDDDLAAEMYILAQELLSQAGYTQYEISNWARRTPHDLPWGTPYLACRHNLHYWRNEPYFALGAGAHGYDGRTRYAHIADPEGFIARIMAGESTRILEERLSLDQTMDETMMLGLRLLQGVAWEDFQRRFGKDPRRIYAEALADLAEADLIEQDAQGVRLSRRGLLLGNRVFAAFLRD